MYKKVLVVLHDSILPHMSKPTLMIDFLTAAYQVGKLSSVPSCIKCMSKSLKYENREFKHLSVIFILQL